MSKRQEIAKIIHEFVTYAKEQEFPYFDEQEKVDKFMQTYTTGHIAGLINKYMRPAYGHGIEALEGYIRLELDRAKLLAAANGADEKCLNFQLCDEHLQRAITDIIRIIDIIDL